MLYVGALLARKGLHDLIALAHGLPAERFAFTLVGPRPPEADRLLAGAPAHLRVVPKQPQHTLVRWYAEGDVFVFPTIEDGFAVVLAQAQAAGLPLLATTNCAGPDLIREGETGWVLPIREPQAFAERLCWADAHRVYLAEMTRHVYEHHQPREWIDVAAEFVELCRKGQAEREIMSRTSA